MKIFILACLIVTLCASIGTIVLGCLSLRLMRDRDRDRESRREGQR